MSIWRKVHVNKKAHAWEGDIPIYFSYTVGPAGEKFFTALKEKGVFVAVRCRQCGKVYLPPRIYCEVCMEDVEEFVEVQPEGRVVTWTEVTRDSRGSLLEKPELIGFINIYNTDGGIIHKIVAKDFSKESLTGAEVKAVLKPPAERSGELGDILYFELKV